jgi:hypothetical protein
LHLPNAVNLPKSQVEALAPELLRLGYTFVRVFRGGKADWRRAGLPTVRSA